MVYRFLGFLIRATNSGVNVMQEFESQIENKGKMGQRWFIILFFVIYIIWMVYVGSQTPKTDPVSTNTTDMSSNDVESMPSEMPDNMSGMNHP
jgi:hypothetical protein